MLRWFIIKNIFKCRCRLQKGYLGVMLGWFVLSMVVSQAAPMRVVSINLCTDELAMLLAAPGQLKSVTWLGADAHETPLAHKAKNLIINHGLAEEILFLKPDLVLAGPSAKLSTTALLKQAHIPVIEVPTVEKRDDIETNVIRVARALGHPEKGRALNQWFRNTLPHATHIYANAIVLQSGGLAMRPDGAAAALFRSAGVGLMPDIDNNVEAMLRNPPQLIIKASYRQNQNYLRTPWLQNKALQPITARVPQYTIDSRSFTCMSPVVAWQLAALSRQLEQ